MHRERNPINSLDLRSLLSEREFILKRNAINITSVILGTKSKELMIYSQISICPGQIPSSYEKWTNTVSRTSLLKTSSKSYWRKILLNRMIVAELKLSQNYFGYQQCFSVSPKYSEAKECSQQSQEIARDQNVFEIFHFILKLQVSFKFQSILCPDCFDIKKKVKSFTICQHLVFLIGLENVPIFPGL